MHHSSSVNLPTCLIAFAMASLAAAQPSAKAPRQPNFVVIFTDDLGYGDLGCYGSKPIKTPRIDAMA